MPRLVNSRTGVVVNVSDETAAGLPPVWEAKEAEKAKTDEKPARRSSNK